MRSISFATYSKRRSSETFEYDRARNRFSVSAAIGWPSATAFDPCRARARPPAAPRCAPANPSFSTSTCGPIRAPAPSARSNPAAREPAACGTDLGTPYQPIGAILAYAMQPPDVCRRRRALRRNDHATIAEAAGTNLSNQRMRQVIESIRDARSPRSIADCESRTSTRPHGPLRGFEPLKTSGRRWKTSRLRRGQRRGSPRPLSYALQTDRWQTFENLYKDRCWYEFRVYPFSDGIAAYVRDITQRHDELKRIFDLNVELERRVEKRTMQLELANKELESFSYSVSHDLRAPLRAIDGFSIALVEDYSDQLDDRARNYLDRVRKAAQRMADLIDALLKLARVARAAIVYTTVDLSAIVDGFVGELRERDPARSVEFVVEPGLLANGEPNLLRAVLENLIGNAFKFTREAKPARIEFGRNDEGEFFVRDNGAGFDMAYRNKLFGAFQRLHAVEEYEGTELAWRPSHASFTATEAAFAPRAR